MLKRKIYQTLLYWKKTKTKECLLVKGARQIGKTFIIERFGREQYGSYVYLNFFENPGLKAVFDDSLQANEIYKKISLFVNNVRFIERDTLIFLDEIQECPNARTALKFLALDNKYDVIASGSLLGLHYRETASIPVGYEKTVEMHSLDFEEFLWAMGKTQASVLALRDYFDRLAKVDETVNDAFLRLIREYMVIGGMPEAVNTFLKTNNFREVYDVQKKITDSYREDVKHYASIPERQKISDCYNSIPRQLAKEYTKFQYKVVGKNGSARRYGNSLNWLIDAGLVKMCVNVSAPLFPLVAYEKNEQFKIYLTDIGLLTCLYGFETQAALMKNTLKGPAKGGIYENLIFDILTKRDIDLHYYKNDRNTMEIEFLYDRDGDVVPVEVKSNNVATPSLNSFTIQFNPARAYKMIAGNLGVKDAKISLPFYMALFI